MNTGQRHLCWEEQNRGADTRNSKPCLTRPPPRFSLRWSMPTPRIPPPVPLLNSGDAKSLHHLGSLPTQPVAASYSFSRSRSSVEDSRCRLCNPCLSIHRT
uniref:Uncharacterized protein n=1 Tax=Triticum urartu TaxID=4572 RepID=A0A8R7PH89_TRIUA